MPAAGAAGSAAYTRKKQELLLELLEELNEEQVAVGHAGGGGMSLADVRWDLERVALDNQSSLLLLAAADEAALQVALQAAPGWRAVNDGWQIVDEAAGDRIQTARAYRALARSALRYIQFISPLSCKALAGIRTSVLPS